MCAAQNFGALMVSIEAYLCASPHRERKMLPFAPYLSDGIGRRKTLSLGCFVIAGGVILQTLSKNTGQFIASRCLSSFNLSTAVTKLNQTFSDSWSWYLHDH
jgi:MFS family permease